MSYLYEKSQYNLEAAELLIAAKKFAPSVHCSYYCLLQFALASFLSKEQLTEENLIRKHSTSKHRSSTHAAIRAELFDKIKAKDRYGSASFNSTFNMLKKHREDADYHNVEIDKHTAEKAERLTKQLKQHLKQIGL